MRASTTQWKVVVALLTAVLVIAVAAGPAAATDGSTDCGGCSPGYWKNHPEQWVNTGYSPSQTLNTLFTFPSSLASIGNNTLMEALNFSGGPTLEDAARLLLHQAVAALLNGAHEHVHYRWPAGFVIYNTNRALASLDISTMFAIKDRWERENNSGCTLN
jgi:hypothetical protein